jgi:hypothetical protein
MCVVIDANCFGLVFSKTENGFTPVKAWIYKGSGRMIYGGTKYNRELRDGGMLNLLKELSTVRKTAHIPNATVDSIAAKLKIKFPEAKFNDEHIAALVIASRCRVVCSVDDTAVTYLKRPDVFAGYAGVKRPKIFRGHEDHAAMCSNKYVVAACQG